MKTDNLNSPREFGVAKTRGHVGARAGTPGPTFHDAAGNDNTSPDITVIGMGVSGDSEMTYLTTNATGQTATNDSGADLAYGDVVILQADGSVATTTTAQDTRPIGVVQTGGADGDPVQVLFSGYVAQVNTTGTVLEGEYLETSTSAGDAQSNAARRTGSFALALADGPNPPALLFGIPDSVTGSGSGGLPWLYAQADGGCTGDGVTDDTTALQALIDTATANGTQSGWIWFEPGVYLIGGALQDTGDFNSQILLPVGASAKITLTLQGPTRPSQGMGLTAPGVAILRSSLTGASGTAAVFSAGNTTSANLQVVLRDLFCVAPENPSLTFWNLLYTIDGLRDGLHIRSDASGFATQPSHSNAYGIKMPETNQSSYGREHIIVQGFYWGIRHAELTFGDYIVWNCYKAIEIPFSHHLGGRIFVDILSCPYGIVVTGANQLDIVYDAEHWSAEGLADLPGNFPAWSANVYDLDDGSNLLSGHIRWWGVKARVAVDHVFQVNGGANVAYEEMGELPDAYPTGPAGGDLSGTYPNPSVVDDSHSHTAATLPASSSGEILITDTPAGTPLVFADLLQNEAQDDLLYADA